MANIVDYIKWRGDITFTERAFNEVDNLVFSLCSYFDFSGSVPETDDQEKEPITIEQAYHEGKDKKQSADVMELLKYMADAPRYKNLLLSNYIDILDYEQEKTQFAALTIQLDDSTRYVAFRGTDNTIVGWQEDFSMSYQIIPAQRYAGDYLKKVLMKQEGKVVVGGHSKGGNLSFYAALELPLSLQKFVSAIYSNDGPGLCPDIVCGGSQKQVLDKLIRIVPDFSIIGSLFEGKSPDHIVKSSVTGILEHDAFTWQIEKDMFVESGDLTEKCKHYNMIFNDWIEDVEMSQRQSFTRDFFGTLEKGGAHTMEEVAAGGFQKFEDILFTFGRSEKRTKFVVGKLIKSFFKGIGRIDFFDLIKTKRLIQGVALILLGVLFICFQELAAKMVGTAFFLWLLMYSVYRLFRFYQSYKNGEKIDQYKALFYGAIAGIEILCIIKNNIILLSVNLILGGFFLWHSWNDMKKMTFQRVCKKRIWLIYLADCIISGIFGIVALAISNRGSGDFSLVAGSYLLFWGFSQTIHAMYQNMKN